MTQPIHRVQAAGTLADHLLVAAARAIDQRPPSLIAAREYVRLARHAIAVGVRGAAETGTEPATPVEAQR